jgi:hypothetical protein
VAQKLPFLEPKKSWNVVCTEYWWCTSFTLQNKFWDCLILVHLHTLFSLITLSRIAAIPILSLVLLFQCVYLIHVVAASVILFPQSAVCYLQWDWSDSYMIKRANWTSFSYPAIFIDTDFQSGDVMLETFLV